MRCGRIAAGALLVCLVSLASAAPALSQSGPASKAPAGDAPTSEAKVRELILVTKADRNLKQIIPALSSQIMGSILQRVPNLSPQVKADLTAVIQNVMLENSTLFVEAAIPIYQKHLTDGEVTGLIAFMRTPVGQAYVEKSPLIAVDMFKVGGQIGQLLSLKAAEAATKMLRDKGYNL